MPPPLVTLNASMWTDQDVTDWALCWQGAGGACVAFAAHMTASCLTGFLVTAALIACCALLLLCLVFLLNVLEHLLTGR